MNVVVTGTMSITAVGYGSQMTAASVRAGMGRLKKTDEYYDQKGNLVSVALIGGTVHEEYEEHLDENPDEYSEDCSPEYDGEDLEVSHITKFAKISFKALLDDYFCNVKNENPEIHVLLGVASESRPGPRYEGINGELASVLTDVAMEWSSKVRCNIIRSGNASTLRCIDQVREILQTDNDAICIVGGIDSLLAEDTMDWFEKSERLKSETFGRNQGFSPAEAVAFTIIESASGARLRNKKPFVEISGLSMADEPAPFLSDEPSKCEGLTNACKKAIAESSCEPSDICTVMSDLNGEYFSMKEWSYAESRCFNEAQTSRELWHPADCFGCVGAASGVVLINIAVIGLIDGWLKDCAMVFCSDDGPECGAVVLRHNIEK